MINRQRALSDLCVPEYCNETMKLERGRFFVCMINRQRALSDLCVPEYCNETMKLERGTHDQQTKGFV